MTTAIILAGGVGSRVGADRPKQFIEVQGKPILAYTIERFQNHAEIDSIAVVCLPAYMDYMEELKEKYGFSKVWWIVKGGETFQASVLNGVTFLEGKIDDDDIVLTHFGASPFVEADIISDAIRVCKEKGNAISTTDFFVLSAIKDDDTKSSQWIDRDTIACMNSPHAFRFSFISELYRKAIETGVIHEVEPHTTTLMQKMGETIYFSKGSQTNIKITKKEDVALFEGYLLMKQKYEGESAR